jgi:hypothetical protein
MSAVELMRTAHANVTGSQIQRRLDWLSSFEDPITQLLSFFRELLASPHALHAMATGLSVKQSPVLNPTRTKLLSRASASAGNGTANILLRY